MNSLKNLQRPPVLPGPGGGSYLDWSTHIRVKKHEFGESFTVFIFLGDVPEDPEEWYSSPSYVGDHNVIVFRGGGAKKPGEDTFVQGVVHMNKAIVARSGLTSLDEDVVVPYLEEKLSWRVRTVRMSFSSSCSFSHTSLLAGCRGMH